MRAAVILSGQPRFTPDLTDLFNQLQGIVQIDLFMVLWKSPWAEDEATARTKFEKILPSHWSIAELKLIDEPDCILPDNAPDLGEPKSENVAWWYQRQYSQCIGMWLTASLIPKDQYDILIRVRGDCSLDSAVNFQEIDFGNKIIMPNNALGWPDHPFNDQFFAGSYSSMMTLFTCMSDLPRYIPISDPNWANAPHGKWRGEWLIGTFLRLTGLETMRGPFNVRMNTYGRSAFTDKHFHHGIAQDPTS
jgi:hypothetical protein